MTRETTAKSGERNSAAASRQISSDFSQFTYPRLLRLQAQTRPDARAVVTAARAITWKGLDDEALEHAAALLALGVAHGDKIGILMANCCEWVVWAHAAAGIGGVVGDRPTRAFARRSWPTSSRPPTPASW